MNNTKKLNSSNLRSLQKPTWEEKLHEFAAKNRYELMLDDGRSVKFINQLLKERVEPKSEDY